MSTYQPGEIVDITIKGARIVRSDGTPRLWITIGERDVFIPVFDDSDPVTVERVVPAEWPPRPGDLWRDRHGELWFIHENPVDKDAPHMGRTAGGERWTDAAAGLIDDNAPLTLVHREKEGAL